MHPRKHFPPISTFWKLHTSRFLLALLPSPNVGHSPPLNEKSPKIVFKMGKKKRLNLAFLTQNSCSLGDFSLDVIGSYPPPPPPTHPLTENHFARKKLSRIGGAPSLTEKIRYVVFDALPLTPLHICYQRLIISTHFKPQWKWSHQDSIV